ncbi:aminoglycoside phosphotransferase [Paracoccus pantotrophus]|nr:aminoglycoside phosphotransferase [Paracoccus pantotrophus]WGR67663.1 aminoglycoside phosphotransferase [Paracoccus pantotrophus]
MPPHVTRVTRSALPGEVAAEENTLLSTDPPAISLERAAEIAEEVFGVRGQFRALSSERDANFHLRLADGTQALLKITNAREDRAVTAMQTKALIHLAAVAPELPVQRICTTRRGEPWEIVTEASGEDHVVRLLTYLDGTMLVGATAGPELHRGIGSLLARVTKGLRGFFHPAAGHELQWDMKHAAKLRPLLGAVDDAELQRRLTRMLDRFDAEIAPKLPLLRAQIVHNDLNPHNVVVDNPLATRPTGVIDFGDMVHTPLACDLAVACSYHLGSGKDPLHPVAEIVGGYASVLPLEREEIDLLPELIQLRHMTTLAISAWRAARYPENAGYILRNAPASLRGLDCIDQIGTRETAALLRQAVETARGE